MKLRLLLILATAITLFNSCNKDENGVGGGVNGSTSNVFVADINGISWAAEDGYARVTPTFGLELNGVHGTISSINMVISPYNGPQTYQVNGITKITYTENGVSYSSTTGQITISADNDQYIEGFFSCEMISNTGSQSLSFTNGQFQAPKQ